ncbi:MAG: hypothetical protein JWM11_5938 [Planctomycetaceae bacterium]|nr:hypothetical protein [Planctomycetaceae bacterium]
MRSNLFLTRSNVSLISLSIVCAMFSSTAVADPAVTQTKTRPANAKFVVFSADEDTELAAPLFKILRGKDKFERILKANSLKKAVASEADVLILVLPRATPLELDSSIIQALKKKKLIGFGAGAASLFGSLGLEIQPKACESFGPAPPDIFMTRSTLLGNPKSTAAFPILMPDAAAARGDAKLNSTAMFIPPDSPEASIVDVIARCTGDSNYAPIVRQKNCLWFGIPHPASRWSEAYSGLVRDACRALHEAD